MFSAVTNVRKFSLSLCEGCNHGSVPCGGRDAISSFKIGSTTAYVLTVAMKSGSFGIGKNPAAVALGRMGGQARAKALTKKRRSEISKRAAQARWGAKK
jgi:hypothetical protein